MGRPVTARTLPPFCEHCGELLVQKEGERPSTFARRRFCSRACFSASRATPTPPKDCEYCGELLVQREKDRPNGFAKRRFCDHECAVANQVKDIDVLGVTMTRQELADVLGVSKSCVVVRIYQGRCPITGKRNE